MAKPKYSRFKSEDAIERLPTNEKLRHHRNNKNNDKYKKKEVHKNFENSKNIKELTIKSYKENNLNNFYRYLKFLQELQQKDKKFLVKSLCDISKEIDNPKIKLEVLEIAYQTYDYDTVTLSSYGSALAQNSDFEKAFEMFEKSLKINSIDTVTLSSYGSALAQNSNFEKAFEMFEKSLKIDSNNTVTLNSYGSALAQNSNFEKAFEMFEKSLKIDSKNLATIFQYVIALENNGRFERAIEVLEKIKTNIKLDNLQLNFIYFTLARLYYATKAKILGDKCFEVVLKYSSNKNATLLKSAREILRYNPYSKDAIDKLREIAEHSSEYKKAIKIMFHNMTIEEYFNQFSHLAEDEIKFKEVDEIAKAIFHKIANQLFILKNRVSEYTHLDVEFKNILDKIEKISININEKKTKMKRELAEIEKGNYKKLIKQISKASHDIADIVINNLVKIKSDIDFILYDKNYKYFNELKLISNQLKINLSTMESLKSINQPIKLNNKTFRVKDIFKTFENNMHIKEATIKLNILNGDDKFYGDREKIVEFLNELIENSIKYKKEDKIEIFITSDNIENIEIEKTKHSGKFLFINYKNIGGEIEKDKKQKIFLPLYSSNKEGSGLGLFIIKKTVELMKGYIIEDGKDEVNFKIYLPYRS